MNEPNIILTGFMGTGKTAVGRAVAEHLGRYFIDMDAVIEARAAKPISSIFAEEGEAAFRRMEAELCRELAGERRLVIATGGGTLVPEANRRVLAGSGLLICLVAKPEDIFERLHGARDRPLLQGPERRQRIMDLLHQRQPAYSAIPHQVQTSGLTVEAVARQVLQLYRRHKAPPTRIPVTFPGVQYNILIGESLLWEAGRLLLETGFEPGRCAVISNPTIADAHAGSLTDGLVEVGFSPTLVEIPEGEAHKTLATVATIYDRLLAAKLDRRSPVIALGGGVVGDVAGYAAATFLRGVPFVQVPTSLLAMVDASVGGKTGVDLPQGKNLVGAFKQPALVVIDPEVLRTLPAVEFCSGLAEVVKHSIIGRPALFAALGGRTAEPLGEPVSPLALPELIAEAVRVKVAVVEEDPFEGGRRAVLNLGHTFAHALEVLSGYELRHGEAVAIGLAAATRLAARLELCDPSLVDRVEGLLLHLGLPVRVAGIGPADVVAAMGSDKKRVGDRLRFVLPRDLGDVDVFDDVAIEDVLETLNDIVTPA